MKVLNYLQVGNLPEKEYLDYLFCDIFRTYHKKCKDEGIEASLAKFMTQPFKPEMIAEYFEGWYSSNVGGVKLFVKKDKYSQIEIYDKFYCIATLDEQKCTDTQHNKFPRTLDDFINDCQRAGIELEWRKQ